MGPSVIVRLGSLEKMESLKNKKKIETTQSTLNTFYLRMYN